MDEITLQIIWSLVEIEGSMPELTLPIIDVPKVWESHACEGEDLMKELYRGYTIEVTESDEPMDNARESCDMVGMMACNHRRYDLGDPKVNALIPWDSFSSWGEVEAYITETFKPVLILPLYLYDHSGLSMQTQMHGYHGAWDCGQVGYIFTTEKWLKDVIGLDPTDLERLTKILLAEVESYSHYLNGTAYQYMIFEGTDPDADMEEIVDMETGDESEECALSNAKDWIDSFIEQKGE